MEIGQEENHTEKNGENVGVCDDAFKEFGSEFMFKKPDAVGEKSDIEGDDKAAVGDDSGGAESIDNNRVAEESGIIKDKGKLGFIAEATF